MSKIDSAIAFAATAHAGQKRKYDGLPYITHPIEVMTLLHLNGVTDEDMLVAAVLHDVIEDCNVSAATITRRFGAAVAALVVDLTDVYVLPEQGNRATRKALERERLATIDPRAQTIKYADFISNTRSIVAGDENFAKVYLLEKEAIMLVMDKGDAVLRGLALESLAAGQQHFLDKALR